MEKIYTALVVDDDEDICNAVTRRLNAINHKCDCAFDYSSAMDYFEAKKYDYIILDMELPIRAGGPVMVDTGLVALKTFRKKYGIDELPIIVFTSKLYVPGNAGSICNNCLEHKANCIVEKAAFTSGNKTLETAIMNALNQNVGDLKSSSSRTNDWFLRIPSEDGNKMTWKTIARNGQEHFCTAGPGTIRGRLLDCIYRRLDKGNIVCDMDLILASKTWGEETYYSEDGNASRGPMKNHVSYFRTKLGMKITFVKNGIKIEQPDE
jgi:CheY-like chemotaxis protein